MFQQSKVRGLHTHIRQEGIDHPGSAPIDASAGRLSIASRSSRRLNVGTL
jgi:hypothetical protein